jgi:hypothetical protein
MFVQITSFRTVPFVGCDAKIQKNQGFDIPIHITSGVTEALALSKTTKLLIA